MVFDHMDRRGDRETPFFLGDVRDSVAVTEAMAHADAWIHLAAVLGTQETITNPRPAAESNLMGGLNMLEAAAQYGCPGVYIGVGNWWMENTYSISKTMIERFVRMFNAERGTRINIVRAMNAYGPGQEAAPPYGSAKVRKITPAFICRALAGADVEVYGDGSQISDMVWVGDVASALVSAVERASEGDVFPKAVEVGPDTHQTVNQVAQLIIELCDSKSKIKHLPMRPGELAGATVSADTGTLSYVGMHPAALMPLREGMIYAVDYFKGRELVAC
jgi:UDP-glucose 4-epimerase